MPQQTNNISSPVRKWAIICGGGALLVGAVVVGILYRGGRPDPREATRLAAEQLTVHARGLVAAGKFDAAAGAIESFFKQHPDAPDLPELWALRIVSHRKAGDSKALLSVAGMAEKFQGRGRDLCDVGVFLAGYECYQDAAHAFKLAEEYASIPSVRRRACYQAAMCNYRMGRFAMAMKYIDGASALSPDDPKITAAVKRIEDARFVADK